MTRDPLPRRLLPVIALGGLVLLASCATPTGTPSRTHNPRPPETANAAQLRPGDSLIVTLQGIPDPSAHNLQIDDQGTITLPFIGTMIAAGITASDLSTRIRESYISRDFYKTINVSVSVTERYVYVGGEVQRPGRILWTPDLTLAKAIQAAGGFTLYAKETAVSLVREPEAYQLDARLAQSNPTEDPRLMPGDSLQVPRSAF